MSSSAGSLLPGCLEMQQQAQTVQAPGQMKGHRPLEAEMPAGSRNYPVAPVSTPDTLVENRLKEREMLAVQ